MSSARRKGALSAVSAVTALALLGGAVATFTDTFEAPEQRVASGTVNLGLSSPTSPVEWTDPIENLAAGDSVTRLVDLSNTGTLDARYFTVSQTNLGSDLVANDGVSVSFLLCDSPYDTDDHECSGTETVLLPATLLAGWNGPLPLTDRVVAPGGALHLKEVVHLANTAPNELQAKSDAVTFSFSAEQRAGRGEDGQTANPGTLTAPSGLTATSPSTTTGRASWSPVPNATGYLVSVSEDGGAYSTPTSVAGTSYDLAGLTPGRSYAVKVATVTASGTSAFGTPAALTTGLAAPTALTTSAFTETTASLAWSAVPGATGYVVQVQDGATWNDVTTTTGPAATISGLASGTTYTYRVLGTSGAVRSDPSTATTATTTPSAPAAPTVTATTGDSVSLEWAPVTGATSYRVERFDGTTWTTAATSTTPSATAAGLDSGESIDFRVIAVGSADSAPSPTVSAITTVTAPSNLTAGTATTTSIPLSWDSVRGAKGYVLDRSTDGGATWTSTALPGTGTSTTVSGLTAGTDYTFRLRATGTSANSAYGAPLATITVPSAPAAPTVTSVTANSAVATIAPVPGATSYRVETSPDGTTWTTVSTNADTAVTLSNLTPGASYSVRATAVNAAGESVGASSSLVTLPGAVTGLTVGTTTANTAPVSWTATPGAASYLVEYRLASASGFTSAGTTAGTSFTVPGLTAGSDYVVRVTAKNSAGASAAASATAPAVTKLSPPSPWTPTALPSATSVAVAWPAVGGATSYTVTATPTAGGTARTAYTGTGTSFTDAGLPSGTGYTYTVTASGISGAGTATSTAVTATTTTVTTVAGPNLASTYTTTSNTSNALPFMDVYGDYVYYGSGNSLSRKNSTVANAPLESLGSTPSMTSFATGADGTLYYSGTGSTGSGVGARGVWRLSPGGSWTEMGAWNATGAVTIGRIPLSIAVTPTGTVFAAADAGRIFKIEPNGTTTLFSLAGGVTSGSYVGMEVRGNYLYLPSGNSGKLYRFDITDTSGAAPRTRLIGTADTSRGTAALTLPAEGVNALEAEISIRDVEVASDGTIYVLAWSTANPTGVGTATAPMAGVYRLTAAGTLEKAVGKVAAYASQTAPATAGNMNLSNITGDNLTNNPLVIAFNAAGRLFIAVPRSSAVYSIAPAS